MERRTEFVGRWYGWVDSLRTYLMQSRKNSEYGMEEAGGIIDSLELGY
jgi:hypothetical protein